MRTMLIFMIVALSAGTLAGQRNSDSRLEGEWTGDVACRHAGGDSVAITLSRDSAGRLVGSSDWALARSDGRKGPQLPFARLTGDGTSIVAIGQANDQTATLRATLQDDGSLRGSWRIAGVDDEWSFVARRAARR